METFFRTLILIYVTNAMDHFETTNLRPFMGKILLHFSGFQNMNRGLAAEAEGERGLGGDTEDEDLKKAFDEWKSKPYALTVPFRIVGLRGSVPPAWLKVGTLFSCVL